MDISRSVAERTPGELYQPSVLFRKASAYAKRNHDEWYILSAKHGLLDSDGPAIEPYGEPLTNATLDERATWAATVEADLKAAGLLRDDVTLVFHAGRAYTESLAERVEPAVDKVVLPTESLPFGETLSWYNEHLPDQ